MAISQTPASSNASGIVTIFRESPTIHAPFEITNKNHWPKNLHMKLLLDGKPLLDMHAAHFASFRVPAGRHVVSFEKLAGADAQFELHDGERVFVRPGVTLNVFRQESMIDVVSCQQAVAIGKDAEPMEAKWVLLPDPLPEEHFPATCESK